MKHWLVFLLAVLSALSSQLSAYTPLEERWDGTMMPVRLEVDEGLRRVCGDSLKPVMVNYVARHGARYLSSANKVTKLRKTLSMAREVGTLTGDGAAFLHLLGRVDSLTAGRWGALDSLGMAEQRALARQMHGLCPELLGRGVVRAESTYVPRVVMSMYEFCHELCVLAPDLEISTAEGKRFSPLLRFFDTDSAYRAYIKKGPWQAVYDRYAASMVPTAPARRLVGGLFIGDSAKYREMTMQMYGVLQSLRATGMGEPNTRWMSEEEYELCWSAANLQHCLVRTATPLSSLPADAARPLLRSIIASMDSAGISTAPVAMLRFGHAETLMPLFSLMRLPGCNVNGSGCTAADARTVRPYSQRVGGESQADAHRRDNSRLPTPDSRLSWRDYEVVPLGANLVILTLRSPSSGRTYVALRLNGRFVSPLPGDTALLVPWSRLRSFWQGLL